MTFFERILAVAGLVCVSVVAVASPWMFGAWEMWWFWPFTVLIFLALLFFALRLIIAAWADRLYDDEDLSADEREDANRIKRGIVYSFLPLLVYAFVRLFTTAVFMDAERSVLLLLTPFLLGILVLFGMDRKQRQLLFLVILLNLFVLGIYGFVNHVAWDNKLVLWTPGEPQYQTGGYLRATGSYFCPDHFAGIMELALCICIGLIMTRDNKWPAKAFASIIAAIALAGIVFSKSRGGGLTVIVITIAALIWGFRQWQPAKRWMFRGSAFIAVIIALVAFCYLGRGYMTRFTSYFALGNTEDKPVHEVLVQKLSGTSRGRMYPAAIRAWKSEPIFGIGPGMHQNLWPHFAPTTDGDRELGVWPTQPNNTFHSFEVHSDWIQFLEEYGALGMTFFLIPFFAVFRILIRGLHYETRIWRKSGWTEGTGEFPIILGGLLCAVCMTFHSFGDFNLQMPATVWMLALIISISLAHAVDVVTDN